MDNLYKQSCFTLFKAIYVIIFPRPGEIGSLGTFNDYA